jgi:hypothetical protein
MSRNEFKLRRGEDAATLIKKLARALSKPGLPRKSVFRGNLKKVFAYSAHPTNASLLVREAADGTQVVGKIGANGRFRI